MTERARNFGIGASVANRLSHSALVTVMVTHLNWLMDVTGNALAAGRARDHYSRRDSCEFAFRPVPSIFDYRRRSVPESSSIDRRRFLGHAAAAAATLAAAPALARAAGSPIAAAAPSGAPPAFDLDEATVGSLQQAMATGKLTAVSITERYLARIRALDKAGPAINAIIELNPDALAIARERDAERLAGRSRGLLHGIPVLIKDNIDTGDKMRTTAGSLALAGTSAPRDAFIAERLRAAGAVILGKTNLSEWANFRSSHSTSGWSGRGGQTRNPYVLDRNPCGSSSGTGAAISANFAAIGIGSETDGSVICPSAVNGLVGIKPTIGLVSRSGIIPISASQDTAGPMARTVRDAAVLLGVLAGADPRDPATSASAGHVVDYAKGLDASALRGARIGVVRNLAGFLPSVDAVYDQAVAALRAAGAVIVDPVELTTLGKFDEAELEVLLYEFKDGIETYLASRGPTFPFKTLADLIAYNQREKSKEMPHFGQELFERAAKKGPLTDAAYRDARALSLKLARDDGLDAAMAKHQVDILISPSNAPAWTIDHVSGDHVVGGNTSFAAVAGYPSVTVPMGQVTGLPVGLSFTGRAWSEAALLSVAFAFEQATKARRGPKFVATLGA